MSAITPYQPTLPPEAGFTDAEIDFMESEPPGLFPENQDSNFGLIIRKIFTDRVQELINQQDTIYNERFVNTSTQYLDEWERQESVPVAPSGLDVATRQNVVLNRLRKGPFTRTARRQIVENYISATFGTPASLSPSGIALTSGGVPLYSGSSGDPATLYEIVEDIPNFFYHIYIDSSVTPATGMQRELARITPAGIQFDIAEVANAAPRLYWKLNDPAGSAVIKDYSAFAHPSTAISGLTFGVKPGLSDLDFSTQFPNGGGYARSGYSPFTVGSQRTFMGWAWRNATTDQDTIFTDASGAVILYLQGGNEYVTWQPAAGSTVSWASAWPTTGAWVHWALTVNDSTRVAELYINGVSKGTFTPTSQFAAAATQFQLSTSGANGFGGYMHGAKVYERIVSAAEIAAIFSNGFNLS